MEAGRGGRKGGRFPVTAAVLTLATGAFRRNHGEHDRPRLLQRHQIPKWTKLTKQVINLDSMTVETEKQRISSDQILEMNVENIANIQEFCVVMRRGN